MNLDNIPNYIKKTITAISKLSLGMYLTSYIFDDLFYGILNRNISSTLDKFKYIILVVFAVFCCSMLLSSAIKILQILYNKLINIIKKYKLRCME